MRSYELIQLTIRGKVIMVKCDTIEDKLQRFHTAFQHDVDQPYRKPDHVVEKLKTLRVTLIEEEYKELLHAIENEQSDAVLKELCDLVYVCVGFAVTYGWDFNSAFNRVHQSNMSKLDGEGNPVFREDGKVIKSDNYKPPNLKDCV